MARLSAFSAVNYSALFGLLTIFFLSGFGHPPAIAQSVNESAETNTLRIDEFSRGVQAVKDKNFQLAVNLFETAAHRSEYEAQYNLAYLLRHGKGRPQNYADALYWVLLAQLGGIEQAEELAEEIEDRLTEKQLEPVLAKVEDHLERRVETGEFEAIPQLADYHHAFLPEADYEQAYLWYAIAVALNLPEMTERRDEMEDKIEPERIAVLQKQTTDIFNRLLEGGSIHQSKTEAANEN